MQFFAHAFATEHLRRLSQVFTQYCYNCPSLIDAILCHTAEIMEPCGLHRRFWTRVCLHEGAELAAPVDCLEA